MKIAILGGSFDPPHLGHLLIAEQIKELTGVDEVWLMPCYKHPLNKKISPIKDRLNMTRLLINHHLKVSDFELKKNQSSYTIDTLAHLSRLKPKAKFFWIIGSDQLKVFREWNQWRKLTHKFNLIFFPREIDMENLDNEIKKYLQLKSVPKNIQSIKSKKLLMTNISSTMIRDRVRAGKSIKYLVADKVAEYIKKHRLYQK